MLLKTHRRAFDDICSHLQGADSADFKGTVWLQEQPSLGTEGSGWRQESSNFLSEEDPALSAEC